MFLRKNRRKHIGSISSHITFHTKESLVGYQYYVKSFRDTRSFTLKIRAEVVVNRPLKPGKGEVKGTRIRLPRPIFIKILGKVESRGQQVCLTIDSKSDSA